MAPGGAGASGAGQRKKKPGAGKKGSAKVAPAGGLMSPGGAQESMRDPRHVTGYSLMPPIEVLDKEEEEAFSRHDRFRAFEVSALCALFLAVTVTGISAALLTDDGRAAVDHQDRPPRCVESGQSRAHRIR